MKKIIHWVLIANGGHAKILPTEKSTDLAKNQSKPLIFEFDHKRLGEIMSDKPGRSFASDGSRRSSMEYSSEPEKEQEKQFAITLLEELDRRLKAQEFARLTIIAEPRMLGTLRNQMSETLKRVVVKELARDWTKLSCKDINVAIEKLQN